MSVTTRNSNLCHAKVSKNDFFFTLMEDVEQELSHYTEAFAGKSVYCFSDDPKKSAFWKFFRENFRVLGLKRLTATFYGDGACCTMFDGEQIHCMPLHGNGDFLSVSDECQAILRQNDILCSNPPFSLFRKIFDAIKAGNKSFLMIGNLNAITAKNIFPFFQSNEIRLGYTFPKLFIRPDGTRQAFGNIGWFTNLKLATLKERPFWITGESIQNHSYPHYANCEGIDVNRLQNIPDDYEGVMGVPISILKHYNPDQFEILGYSKSNPANHLLIQPIPEALLESFRQHGGSGHYTPNMRILCYYDDHGVGHFPFERILLKRKNRDFF